MKIKPVNLLYQFFVSLLFIVATSSCESNEASKSGRIPYDPKKPVKISSFAPDSGGIATKVIIKGDNFGTDVSKVKVFFNDKEAGVVESIGNMIYCVAPRLPGDTCEITVTVDDKSVTAKQKFMYYAQASVTTLAGIPGATSVIDGTLAEATFGWPFYLTLDKDKNIFICESRHNPSGYTGYPSRIRLINEEENSVITLASGGNLSLPNVPTTDKNKETIFIPDDAGATYYTLDPSRNWALKRSTLGYETNDIFRSNYKHAFAINFNDGMIYSRLVSGIIFKFNTTDRIASVVTTGTIPRSDSYPAFNPNEPDLLYVCMTAPSNIYTLNLITLEWKLFAGSEGSEGGFADGQRLDAQFKGPRQIVFDSEGNLYVAVSGNHVIRRIDTKGMVSTVVGTPGVSGYIDGGPNDALFKDPRGVAVDDEDNIYITDTGNRVIRKLAIE